MNDFVGVFSTITVFNNKLSKHASGHLFSLTFLYSELVALQNEIG